MAVAARSSRPAPRVCANDAQTGTSRSKMPLDGGDGPPLTVRVCHCVRRPIGRHARWVSLPQGDPPAGRRRAPRVPAFGPPASSPGVRSFPGNGSYRPPAPSHARSHPLHAPSTYASRRHGASMDRKVGSPVGAVRVCATASAVVPQGPSCGADRRPPSRDARRTGALAGGRARPSATVCGMRAPRVPFSHTSASDSVARLVAVTPAPGGC